jgi:hypothetical protein
LDILEFGVDLSFFGSSINKFVHIVGEPVKFHADQIIEAELW